MRSFLTVSLALLFTAFTAAYAKHRMNHQGYYIIEMQSPKIMTLSLGPVKAHSTCGKNVKGRCAERGRDKMFRCMAQHTANIKENYAPVQCTSKYDIDNYPYVNLYETVKREACAKAGRVDSVVVSIFGTTSFVGSYRTGVYKKSSGDKLLLKNLKISCK